MTKQPVAPDCGSSNRRIRIVFLVIQLLLVGLAQAQSPRQFTNDDVIRLVKGGLSADLIITAIEANQCAFDTSAQGLLSLKQAGVSDKIINAMLTRNGSRERTTAPAPIPAGRDDRGSAAAPARADRKAPLPPDKGVYLWDGKTMHLLQRNEATSMGQNVWRSMTPFVKKKLELQLKGGQARLMFNHNQPTILVSGLGEIIPGIPSFRLLYVKKGGMMKDRRIIGTYDIGGFFGSIDRVDNEIECQVKKMAEGIYSFTPVRPLPDGEYGLVQSAQAAANPLIWDFGIYAEGHPVEKK